MARKRANRAKPAPKRRRDYAAEYKRRQARARALGYESYYARRVRKGAPPSAPKPSGAALRRARGHAAGRDLARSSRDGDLLIASLGGRDLQGRYHRVDVTVIPADGGDEREFTLRGSQLSPEYLQRLVDDLERRGVIFSPSPSLDLRQIAEDA